MSCCADFVSLREGGGERQTETGRERESRRHTEKVTVRGGSADGKITDNEVVTTDPKAQHTPQTECVSHSIDVGRGGGGGGGRTLSDKQPLPGHCDGCDSVV